MLVPLLGCDGELKRRKPNFLQINKQTPTEVHAGRIGKERPSEKPWKNALKMTFQKPRLRAQADRNTLGPERSLLNSVVMTISEIDILDAALPAIGLKMMKRRESLYFAKVAAHHTINLASDPVAAESIWSPRLTKEILSFNAAAVLAVLMTNMTFALISAIVLCVGRKVQCPNPFEGVSPPRKNNNYA
jgi:hypothetical protein